MEGLKNGKMEIIEEYFVEFKNIDGKDIIYNYKEGLLTIVCIWNKK